jgi:hypothetical protein
MFSYYKTLLSLLIIFSTLASATNPDTDPDSFVVKFVRQALAGHARSSQARSSDLPVLATGLSVPRSFMESVGQPRLRFVSPVADPEQPLLSQSDSARPVPSLAESDSASGQTSQWKRVDDFSSMKGGARNKYIPYGSLVIESISCMYEHNNKSLPSLMIWLFARERVSNNPSQLYKDLQDYEEKYRLIYLSIEKRHGQKCIYEGLQIIHSHIPFPDWMVEEICQFMQVGNPFIVKSIPQLCERWFSDIEKLYPNQMEETSTADQQEKAQQEEQAFAEQLFKNILDEIAELRQKAQHIRIEEFLYPLAQKCEAKYGIDDYFTRLISHKICELNPSDYTLRQSLAENLLVNGTPREAAILRGLEELLALPKVSFDMTPILQHILDEKAGGRFGEKILEINFHQPTPAIAAQALNKLTEEVKQRRSLEEENKSLKAEIDRLKALQLSESKETDA